MCFVRYEIMKRVRKRERELFDGTRHYYLVVGDMKEKMFDSPINNKNNNNETHQTYSASVLTEPYSSPTIP